jgi:flagellar hook-associated protein FlgK
MNSITAIASSGLGAAWLGVDVAANNIANAMTPGYRREQLLQQADPAGGVSASVTRLPQPGDDLAADLVGQQMAAYSFKANVRVLQTADSMMGSLLDAFA